MKVTFSLLTGERISIESNPTETIGSFVDRLKNEFHVQNGNIKFVYFGEVVKEEQTLQQLNYFDGAIIYVETIGPVNETNTQESAQNQSSQTNQQSEGNANLQNQQTQYNDDDVRDSVDRFRESTTHLFNMLNSIEQRPAVSTQSETQEYMKKMTDSRSKFPYRVPLTKEQAEERSKTIAERAHINEAFSADRDMIIFRVSQAINEEVRGKFVLNTEAMNALLSNDESTLYDNGSSSDIMQQLRTLGLNLDQANKVFRICRGDQAACLMLAKTMKDTLIQNNRRGGNIFAYLLSNAGFESHSTSESTSSDESEDFQVYHTNPDDFQVD